VGSMLGVRLRDIGRCCLKRDLSASGGCMETRCSAKPPAHDCQVSKILLCKQDEHVCMPNYEFYMNWRRFEPDGEFIKIILQRWNENFDLLENNHDYIQWLFPTLEQGRNFYSKPLNPQERLLMCNTSEIQQWLLRAYKMMLKFFGVKLVGEDGEDTKVTEVEGAENFAERFENLTINTHNNLRITRVLLSLGELGAEEYQAPLVKFLLKEILIEHRLPNLKKVHDLLYFPWLHYEPKEEFMWGRQEELERYKALPSMVAPLLPCTSQKAAYRIIPNGITTDRLHRATTLQRIQVSPRDGVHPNRVGGCLPNQDRKDSRSSEKSDERNYTALWTSTRNRVRQWPSFCSELFATACPPAGYNLEAAHSLQAPKFRKS
uniref:Opioid growth factor receptor (OGFr) conserved domain-containing protein n=1 Tax=Leptobrachium leishanense TaxID=445787 RepID=A0A8C5Q6R9_9ANUR